MKQFIFFIIIIIMSIGGCTSDHPGHDPEAVTIKRTRQDVRDTARKSIKAYARNNINGVDFYISYHSPAVRDRIIWGGLVPYDEVWVTGAHMATSFEFYTDISISNTKISAGKYAFFTIPRLNEWTLILNKNWDQHLADEYDEKEDIYRWTVKPDTLSYRQERLMYDIDQTGERKCNIKMRWEKLEIIIPVEIR